MPVQARANIDTRQLVIDGIANVKTDQTFEQDAGRASDVLVNTLVVLETSTGKWNTFTNEATQLPGGIILQTLAQADVVAGDVDGVSILTGGNCVIDSTMLVIENSKLLTTALTGLDVTVEQFMGMLGIFVKAGVNIDEHENT